MASKKASSKGKRYTPEEKQKIVEFVNQHNAENRRGGASAASKKFGVSQLTVASWLKAGVTSSASGKPTRTGAAASTGSRSKALAELSKLDAEISTKRKELDALEKRFQTLKESL